MSLFTEAEAREKWCPMVRRADLIEDNERAIGERRYVAASNEGARCRASECMAWRWRGAHVPEASREDWPWRERTYGYCGAFGEPHP